ncbi:MAG: prepilin peptidase [bacterium]
MKQHLTDFIVFFLGLTFGSFLGLCAHRIPRGVSVIFGQSKCDQCGAPLSWIHKLPLLGYVLLRGRSRCCSRHISPRYPILEVTLGILFVLFFHRTPAGLMLVSTIFFVGLLFLGTLFDLDHKIIPDKITLSGILVGLLFGGFFPQLRLQEAVLGILLCGGFLYFGGRLGEILFNQSDAMGGGDIKFAAMIGAFLGWQLGLTAIFLAAFAGSAFGLLRIVASGYSSTSREIPFGPFLAFGALLNLLWGDKMLTWYSFMIGGF